MVLFWEIYIIIFEWSYFKLKLFRLMFGYKYWFYNYLYKFGEVKIVSEVEFLNFGIWLNGRFFKIIFKVVIKILGRFVEFSNIVWN